MLRDAALRILIPVTEDTELEVQPSLERNYLASVYNDPVYSANGGASNSIATHKTVD